MFELSGVGRLMDDLKGECTMVVSANIFNIT